MNDRKSPDRNCASLSYILFSRKGRWPASHRKRFAPNVAGSNTPNLSFCHWLFCTYKDQKTYRCQSRAQVPCKLFSGSRRGKCHGVSLLLQAGHANRHPTEEHLPSGQSCNTGLSWPTSQLPLKGSFVCLVPARVSGGVLLPPPSSAPCWSSSEQLHTAELARGISSCFALSKMRRAIYDPLN